MRPGKGFTTAQSNEHKRNWSEKGWEHAVRIGNYDRTREHLNFEIVDGKIVKVDKTKSIPQRIAEILQSRGIKDPNEGLPEPKYRTVANFLFGGTRWRMHQIAFGEQMVNLEHGADNSHIKRHKDIEKWAMEIYNFVAGKWGEENIAGFIVHLDEMNPHIHCTLLPINKENRFAYKKLFNGGSIYEYKEYSKNLHSELFEKVNRQWGLERGSSIAETGARHRSTEEYRRELSQECTTLEEQVEESRTLLRQLKLEVAHAEKRVKGLTTMIANLEQSKQKLEQEMVQLSTDLQAGKGDSIELQKRIDKLGLDYQKVLDALTDKRQKLMEANRKLDEFRTLEEESRVKADGYRRQAAEYQKSVREASNDLTRQIQFRIADALVGDMITELKAVYPKLGDAKNALDATLLEDLAERGESILKCAGMLFAGYVDGATTFAKGCGGGGGGSDLPWGRKDNEDDLHWARRCLFHAARMMRPATGKTVKRK